MSQAEWIGIIVGVLGLIASLIPLTPWLLRRSRKKKKTIELCIADLKESIRCDLYAPSSTLTSERAVQIQIEGIAKQEGLLPLDLPKAREILAMVFNEIQSAHEYNPQRTLASLRVQYLLGALPKSGVPAHLQIQALSPINDPNGKPLPEA